MSALTLPSRTAGAPRVRGVLWGKFGFQFFVCFEFDCFQFNFMHSLIFRIPYFFFAGKSYL